MITTDREKIVWPKLSADVSPEFYGEGAAITPGDPTFVQITSEPQKIAHLVQVSNEVIDDSNPPIVQVLTDHLTTTLGLKLDSAIYTGGTALPGITGMSYLTSTQTGGTITTGGVAGTATGYNQLLAGVGLLRAANAPEPYALACNPTVLTALQRMQDTTGRRFSRRRDCRRSTRRRRSAPALHSSTHRVSSRWSSDRTRLSSSTGRGCSPTMRARSEASCEPTSSRRT